MAYRYTPWLVAAFSLLAASGLFANNGATALAYPAGPITVDGRLNDWPAGVNKHSIAYYHFGRTSDGPGDLDAFMQVAYNRERRLLYVAVTATDDDYVKTPDEDHYTSHDFQVLYLDFLHSNKPNGVISYEVDEHNRKIVEQEAMKFYPQVAGASWDDVEVAIQRTGNTVVYEWQVSIPGALDPYRSIGVDYAIFDKDTDQDHTEISWGEGVIKFRDHTRLGDVILMDAGATLTPVAGQLTWTGPGEAVWPPFVDFTTTELPARRYTAAVDSSGAYAANLPPGSYRLCVDRVRNMTQWFAIDVIDHEGRAPTMNVGNTPATAPEMILARVEKPDIIPDKGLLHEAFTDASARKVDAFVEAYREHYGIPAVSLALIQNGQMVYHRAYGVENTATDAPLRDEAVFEAASITKSVFAYAINRLVQRGELDLDQPLYELLPAPDLEEKYPEYKQMTARHVLTHVSGMPNWGMRMDTLPGTRYGYSGQAFEYLKMAVANSDDDAVWPALTEALLAAEVLTPLGMTNTYFSCNDAVRERKVAGHYNTKPMPYDCPNAAGVAWSMHTEAKDFVPFALALLEREGLTAKQAGEMFRFHTLEKQENWLNDHKTGFGLGIALRESPYGLVFGHGGNNGDFRSTFEIYDELKSGFIVYTNADTAGPLLFDIAQFLVEGKWDWPEAKR